ncbi:hypothetical protein GCM10017687_30100 [Streptomyces echinatus]|uniref:Uncharacterized protein n=1 Tax=Streptomyces echinatus TaxID=67293 RepID=A0A7W9Q318_9ACTN|nr:hypothetical protein [Streptomyces echinatus]
MTSQVSAVVAHVRARGLPALPGDSSRPAQSKPSRTTAIGTQSFHAFHGRLYGPVRAEHQAALSQPDSHTAMTTGVGYLITGAPWKQQ